MKRADYIHAIVEKLSILGFRIRMESENNMTDSSSVSEYFFRDLLKLIYNVDYVNLNDVWNNCPGADLICERKKTIIQVTCDVSMDKVRDCLKKVAGSSFSKYHVKILYNVDKTPERKSRDISVDGVNLNLHDDIITISSMVKVIKSLKVERLKIISDFLNKEIPYEKPKEQFESGLMKIIELLTRQPKLEVVSYEQEEEFDIIKKIEFNNLMQKKALILERCGYTAAIQKVYDMYDSAGQFRSMFIIEDVSREYLTLCSKYEGDALLDKIIEAMREKIEYSASFENISQEQIKFYIDIIVIDAFTRCKIFKRPKKNDPS